MKFVKYAAFVWFVVAVWLSAPALVSARECLGDVSVGSYETWPNNESGISAAARWADNLDCGSLCKDNGCKGGGLGSAGYQGAAEPGRIMGIATCTCRTEPLQE